MLRVPSPANDRLGAVELESEAKDGDEDGEDVPVEVEEACGLARCVRDLRTPVPVAVEDDDASADNDGAGIDDGIGSLEEGDCDAERPASRDSPPSVLVPIGDAVPDVACRCWASMSSDGPCCASLAALSPVFPRVFFCSMTIDDDFACLPFTFLMLVWLSSTSP